MSNFSQEKHACKAHLNTPQKVQLFLVPIWLTIWSMLQPYRSLYDSTCSHPHPQTHNRQLLVDGPPCTTAPDVGLPTSSKARLDQAPAGSSCRCKCLACTWVQPDTRPWYTHVTGDGDHC